MPDIIARVVEWYKSGRGALVLAGDTGCGKTHIARVVYRHAAPSGPAMRLPDQIDQLDKHVEAMPDGLFFDEPRLFDKIRGSYSSSDNVVELILRQCEQTKLLVIDDVGAAYVKAESLDWYGSIWRRIIDARADGDAPLLLTTNLTPVEMKTRIGKRAWSRLQGLLGWKDWLDNYVLMFDIPDYRAEGEGK